MAQDITFGGDAAQAESDKGIQVVSRAAAILRALGRHPEGLSLGAIAEETDLPRSTVQRLVGALELEQFVETMGPRGGTRLGPALGQLARAAHGDIVSVARPHLESMAKAVNETVALAGASGRRAIVVDRVVVERELCIMIPIGVSSNPYTTGLGKALLAELPDDAVRKLFGNRITPETTKTVKDMAGLIAQLERVRSEQIAYEREEHIEDVCSIATPIDTFLGPYSIGIAVPKARFDSNIALFERELRKCKKLIEAEVGR
ncbi:IclR family transcriptional regulator [Burkholderia sp. 22PA0099]|uniref:IclR family transcriptional regulator n=1 Tax=Burkholderia sp. 22PA0099 TaxID=3237372 RepID=UPI0039C2A719